MRRKFWKSSTPYWALREPLPGELWLAPIADGMLKRIESWSKRRERWYSSRQVHLASSYIIEDCFEHWIQFNRFDSLQASNRNSEETILDRPKQQTQLDQRRSFMMLSNEAVCPLWHNVKAPSCLENNLFFRAMIDTMLTRLKPRGLRMTACTLVSSSWRTYRMNSVRRR